MRQVGGQLLKLPFELIYAQVFRYGNNLKNPLMPMGESRRKRERRKKNTNKKLPFWSHALCSDQNKEADMVSLELSNYNKNHSHYQTIAEILFPYTLFHKLQSNIHGVSKFIAVTAGK